MIDKITPRPDDDVARMLKEDGIENCDNIITAKKTYIAPFVNAEEAEYLVLEDAFPNGRPPLEKAGVLLTDRKTVEKTERMKVCTCLNPLHTALAVFGCLFSYTRISEAMSDPILLKLVRRISDEGLPVVTDPVILSPTEFNDTVINVRFPNPFIPDTPQRIATDTSAKLSVRFGETIKEYIRSESMNVDSLFAIPLVLAGWCRYLLGVDDNGKTFELSPDPMLPELKRILEGVSPGKDADFGEILAPLLSNDTIFRVNLFDAGLADRVVEYFAMMTKEAGAVRNTLETTLKNKGEAEL
jgi:fructuronate reductase